MRNFRVPGLICILLLCMTACQKNTSIEGEVPADTTSTANKGKILRIQQGIDPNLANDTVYKITYTTDGKINTLLDSIYGDMLVAGYDANGYLTSITDKSDGNYNATFTYDATSGGLTSEDYTFAGQHDIYRYAYTNGVLSLKSYYSDLGQGGTPVLQTTYAYTITGGNITDVKVYSAAGAALYEEKRTYGSETNPFQQLSLFNYGNRLGTDAIFDEESIFNKNILVSKTIDIITAAVNTNTFNSSGYITGISVIDNVDVQYVWTFSY